MAFLVIVVFILVAAFRQKHIADTHRNKSHLAPTPVAVETAAVRLESIKDRVSAVGVIEALRDIVVISETAGRVTRVYISVGDKVRAGQVLAQVDDELKAIAVEGAQAQLLAAETNLKKAEKDVIRAEKLFASQGLSDTELEVARLGLRAAEAQFKSAQTALQYAKRQYDDTKIKAPIAGIIAAKWIEEGSMVAMGREVANIIDISQVKVKVTIPESEINKIRKGQIVDVILDSSPFQSFQGYVYSVSAKAFGNSHSYPVEILVDNDPANTLKPGMFARAEIEIAVIDHALTIAKECLVDADSDPAVFVVENNIARRRPVQIGVRSGDRLQVLAGVAQGERVVTFGQDKLKDGALVQPR